MAMYRKKVISQICPMPLMGLLALLAFQSNADDTMTYGVQPFIPPLYLERSYGPLVTALSAHLDRPVQFRTRRNIREYHTAIEREAFDIILVNPFTYVRLRDQSNYRALVRRSGELRASVFVVDASFDSLDRLRGRIIGLPPLPMANTILGLQMLHQFGVTPDQYQRQVFNEHVSCKQALSSGQVDACVSSPLFARNTLQSYPKQFINIANSGGIPSSVIMIHNRIAELETPLRSWFLELNHNEPGRDLLESSYLGELENINAEDYDVVLAIEKERTNQGW